jgi:hypothetical protein
MKIIEREKMLSSTEIFADPCLNMRFYTAIELLAQIVMVMPRTVSIASMAQSSGKTPRLIRSILVILSKEGLVARDAKEKDAWHCRDCNGMITLADIYRCFCLAEECTTAKAVLATVATSLETGSGDVTDMADTDDNDDTDDVVQENALDSGRTRSASQNSVDLLMMQVKMTVNRAVLQQLEQFDLGRLRGLASSSHFHSHHARPRGYIPEPF